MTPKQIEKERQAFKDWFDELDIGEIESHSAWKGWLARTEQDEWISVEDRLPEDYCSILVWPTEYAHEDRSVSFGFFISNVGSFFKPNRNKINHVTHWQPLPEPPEENT